MLRLRTLFLCPSNTRSKNQLWRRKKNIQRLWEVLTKFFSAVFPSPSPFPEFSDRVLSQDSRRWRSSNKSADVHLTVNADAVRLVSSGRVTLISVKVRVSGLDFAVHYEKSSGARRTLTLEAKISSFVGVLGLHVQFKRDHNICKY